MQLSVYSPVIMAVMTERPSWSDERLDDLSRRVDHLSHRVDAGFEEVNRRLDSAVSEVRGEVSSRFNGMDDRIDRLQQTLIIFCGSMIAALIAAVTAVFIAILA
jgi:hypothetical protein